MKPKQLYKIQRGVKMPPRAACESRYPFAKMKVGDSFEINPAERPGVYTYAKLNRVKCAVRKFADGSVRVWRIA